MDWSYLARVRAVAFLGGDERVGVFLFPLSAVGNRRSLAFGDSNIDATEFHQVLRQDAAVALYPFTSGEMDWSYLARVRAVAFLGGVERVGVFLFPLSAVGNRRSLAFGDSI